MSKLCRLLLIEDDPREASAIEHNCCPDPSKVAIDVVGNGADAEEALERNEYDVILCDLALPADGRQVDPDTAEGMRLIQLMGEQSRGTPVIIISAHADLHMATNFLDASRVGDLYGTQVDEPLVRFFPKEDLPDCIEAVQAHIAKTETLDAFVLTGQDVDLSLSEERALKIYGRRQGAGSAMVEPFDSGLSAAKTLKVSLVEPDGADAGCVVAKLGDLRRVIREAERSAQAAPRLPVGLGAVALYVVQAGAGRRGALIYQFADEYTSTLFGLLAAGDDSGAARVVTRLRERIVDKWLKNAPEIVNGLSEVRRRSVSDAELRNAGVAIPEERDVEVNVTKALSHGDLHGFNVLVRGDGEPTLIDYGEVRLGNAALDPVTLELSILYHPAFAGRTGSWPSVDQGRVWFDLDAYCEGSPVEEFVRSCRAWAVEASAGDEEMLATAYSYSIRQAKYQEESSELAMAIALGAYEELVRQSS